MEQEHYSGCRCVDCDPQFNATKVVKAEVGGDRGSFIRNPIIIGKAKPDPDHPRSCLTTG